MWPARTDHLVTNPEDTAMKLTGNTIFTQPQPPVDVQRQPQDGDHHLETREPEPLGSTQPIPACCRNSIFCVSGSIWQLLALGRPRVASDAIND
jgi:hypothetical protein